MGFHRLSVPSYTGGLPSGYDYLNNAVLPPGSTAAPAAVDDPKSGGPNAGTYFIGFGEDARSPATNRGLSALGENTDFLDDIVHQDLALPVRTDPATAPSTGTSNYYLTLLGPGIWLGVADGTVQPWTTLFQIVDQNDRPIYANDGATDGTGNPQDYELAVENIIAPGIGGDGRGAGFSPGNVTLVLNRSLPHGVQYRVRYYRRGNFAVLDPAVFAITRDFADSAPITSTPYGTANTNIDFQVQDAFRTLNGLERIRTTAGYGSATNDTVNTIGFDTVQPWLRDRTLIVNPSTAVNPSGYPSIGLPPAAATKGLTFFVVNTDGTLRPSTAGVGQSSATSVGLVPDNNELINGKDWGTLGGLYQLDVPNGFWSITSDGVGWCVRRINAQAHGRTETGDAALALSDTTFLSTPPANGDGTSTPGNVNIQLPPPALYKGRILDLWIRGAETTGTEHTTTLLPSGSESIEGQAQPYVIYQNNTRWSVLCDGTNWYIS